MVVGFTVLSESEIAGSSTGKPPACRMPRLTSSTRVLKWAWHWAKSDQVLMIPMTGRPLNSSTA